jgi:hypothetical protein
MNPRLEIVPTENWFSSNWNEARPVVEQAFAQAEHGIEYLGIRYEQPKMGVIDILPEAERKYAGLSFNALDFKLLTTIEDNERVHKKLLKNEWSCTAVHEVVHCTRKETVSTEQNIMERAATEGLACIAEHLHLVKFCGKYVTSHFAYIDLRPDSDLAEAFTEFSVENSDDDNAHAWFDTRYYGKTLGFGSVFGSQRVYAMLQKGYDIADLIRQPAEDVLGL